MKLAGTEFGAFQSGCPPTTSDGLRISSTAAASPRGNRQVSDVGVAPHFHTAKVVSKNTLLLGSPMATKSPGLTPLAAKARAAVGVALELLPGDGIGAVTDRDGVLWFPFGIPA